MPHIFVSFEEEDLPFVEELCSRIERETDLKTWTYKKDLVTGDRWGPEIDRAIEECLALVLVMTPNADGSKYVTYEWSYTLGCGKPVLVIRLKHSELHPRLMRDLQYIDFRDTPDWDKFMRDLKVQVDTTESNTVHIPRHASSAIKKAASQVESPDPEHRELAVTSLAQIAQTNTDACDVLAEVVEKVPYESTRIRAAIALAELKDSRALPGLLLGMHEKYQHKGMAKQVYRAAFILKDAKMLQPLLEALERDHLEAGAIIQAIGSIGSVEAVPALINILRTRQYDLREAAAGALGHIKDSSSVPALVDVLNKPDSINNSSMGRVRERIAWALGQIATPEAVDGLKYALTGRDNMVRQAVLDALGDAEAIEAVPDIIEALRDQDPALRATAAMTLGRLRANDERAVEALKQRLFDQQSNRRIKYQDLVGSSVVGDVAAWALEQIGTEKVLLALQELKNKRRC